MPWCSGAAVLAGIFVVSVVGLRTRSSASTKHPIVYVSDFLPGFPDEHPPRLADFDHLNMDYILGKRVCVGSPDFVSSTEFAPGHFCHHVQNNTNMAMELTEDRDFDEYAMERIMIGKWLRSPLRCKKRDNWCREHADIVVVPSLVLHRMLKFGFLWDVKNAELNEVREAVDRYWEVVKGQFYRPEANHTPLIIVHSAFAWDKEGYNYVFHALDRQPDSFKANVILPSTGSNLQDTEAMLFGKQWSSGAHKQLLRRAQLRAQGIVDPTPLLITMPYPTSITHPVNFTQSSGAYSYPRSRRISVSMMASVRGKQGANWIRGTLMSRFDEGIGVHIEEKRRFACAAGYEPRDNCGLGNYPGMWDVATNSQFCIEPSGDTLCRANFYISILSGCIPVIVDGGHDLYGKGEPTWWAWRKSPDQEEYTKSPIDNFFIDYQNVAVIYTAKDVKERKVDIMKELREMPTANPSRFLMLQKNIDALAPSMRYALGDCYLPACVDAFAILHEIVLQEYFSQRVVM